MKKIKVGDQVVIPGMVRGFRGSYIEVLLPNQVDMTMLVTAVDLKLVHEAKYNVVPPKGWYGDMFIHGTDGKLRCLPIGFVTWSNSQAQLTMTEIEEYGLEGYHRVEVQNDTE